MAYVDRDVLHAKFMCDENMVAVEKVSVVELAFPASAQVSGALSAAIKDYTQTRGRTYRDFEASYNQPRPIACTGVSWTDPLATGTESTSCTHRTLPFRFSSGACAPPSRSACRAWSRLRWGRGSLKGVGRRLGRS